MTYRTWMTEAVKKIRQRGGRITENTLSQLKETYFKKLCESMIPRYKRWKRTNTLTKKDLLVIRESAKKLFTDQLKLDSRKLQERKSVNNLSNAIKNYKNAIALKENIHPSKVRISYKELKFLSEQVKEANRRGLRLREADMGMDPSMGGAPADPNAAGGMPGAMPTGAPVDPSIVAQVQDAKNSIDALAAAVGVQSTDVNADPNAGIPAVDGMQQPGLDPNAAAGAPMMEARRRPKGDKYDAIRERIEARKKLIENGAQEGAKKDLQRIGIAGGVLSSGQENKGAESNAEQVVVPAAGSLANGYSSGAASGETKPSKTWPTKATKTSDTGGALQGSGASQKKVKEAEECKDEKKEEDKLEESTKSVTNEYVTRALQPKLDFSALKESLANGLLG